MKTKVVLISVLIMCTFTSAPEFDSCEWTHYLGNPQRTGYSVSNGPDLPEVLWKVSIPGEFDTSPFIIEDKVLILWKNFEFTVEAKVLLLDVLTGEILQDYYDPLLSNVFPAGDSIIGTSGPSIYEIDLGSSRSALVAKTPEKGPRLYPVVLKEKIVFPTIPAVCLSTSNFDTMWSLKEVMLNPELDPFSLAGDENVTALIMAEDGVQRLFVVDSSTGVLKWTSDPLSLALSVVLGEDAIYCAGRNLWAFDRNGSEIWHFTPDERVVSNIVLGSDGLYFADEGNNLYKVDMKGNLVWKTHWEVSPWYYETHLIGAGDILYCFGNYGKPDLVTRSEVAARKMEDGSMVWDKESGSSHYVKASPAIAKGILVVGDTNGELIALASNPDLFVKQGDVFLSKDMKEEAVKSYEKAVQLYEREGNQTQSQEMQNRIDELKNQLETTMPQKTPECILPKRPVSPVLTFTLLILAGIFGGILIAYYLIRKKKP